MLLDTNVVSEFLREDPSPHVVAWLRRQPLTTIHLAAPSLAELLVGIEMLPDGRRKTALAAGLARFAARLMNHLLSFDGNAASAYTTLIVRAKQRGKTISVVDGQIAAIASVHRLPVATCDVKPFEAAGLTVINPWDHGVPQT